MRRLPLLLLLLLFALPLSAQDRKKNLAHANELIDKGNYKAAKKFLSSCIEKEINYCEYFALRAHCSYEMDDRMGAIQDMSWAIKLAPDSMRYRWARGSMYQSIAEFGKAIKDYDRALEMCQSREDSVLILSNKGHCQEPLGDTTGAIASLELALKLDSNSLSALNNLAMVLNDVNRVDESIKYLLRVVKIDSTFAGAYTNLGFCYSQKGDYATAIKYFDKCIQVDPKEAFAYNNRGYAKMKNGDLDGALADVKKSIKMFPENSYAYRNLGLIYIEKNDPEKACEAFDEALKYGFSQIYGPEVSQLKKKNCSH